MHVIINELVLREDRKLTLTLFFILSLVNPLTKLYAVFKEDGIPMMCKACSRIGKASFKRIEYIFIQ